MSVIKLLYLRRAYAPSGEIPAGFSEEVAYDVVLKGKRKCPEEVRTA